MIQNATQEPEAVIDYHSRNELSSSQIADFLQDPIKWYHVHQLRDWPRDEPTKAMRFGTDVHRMIELGGPEALKIYEVPRDVLNKDGHRKGKPYTEWAASLPAGATILPSGELNPFQIIWDNMRANPFVAAAIEQGEAEKEIFWTDSETGIRCRMKADKVFHQCFLDWKTTTSISPMAFQSEIYRRFYDIRLAFYRRGIKAHTGKSMRVLVVAIQNSPGHGCRVFELSPEWLEEADARLSRALECIANFDIDLELRSDPVLLSAPRWARYQNEFDSLEDDSE